MFLYSANESGLGWGDIAAKILFQWLPEGSPTRLLAIETKLYCYVCFCSSRRYLLLVYPHLFTFIALACAWISLQRCTFHHYACVFVLYIATTYMHVLYWTRTWTCELRYIGLLNAQPKGIQQQSDQSSMQDQHFEGKTLLMVNVFGVRYCIGMGLPHVATTQWSRKLPLLSPDLSLCAFITNANTQQLHYSQEWCWVCRAIFIVASKRYIYICVYYLHNEL